MRGASTSEALHAGGSDRMHPDAPADEVVPDSQGVQLVAPGSA